MAQGIFSSLAADLKPALFRALGAGYGKGDLRKDLVAGVTVGVVALPLAMAFSIGAGGSPVQGLYTAIVAGFVIALLGGSFHQVSGPTGAFVVIIADVVARHGMDGLVVATILAGIILVALGLSGLGSLVKYIPYPVTVGFTTGIGVIIFSGQVKDLFGMAIPSLSPEFFGKIGQYVEFARTSSPWAAAAGLGTIAIIVLVRRFVPKIPAAVTAVAVVTFLVWIAGIPVETVGKRYGAIPSGIPVPSIPVFTLATVREVFPSALTIAMLAAIESLLSAVVADGMTGTRHSASAELAAQGLGNIASALFGGIPATGAIARTATNIKAGAASPVAAIVHSIVLLLFTLFLGRLAEAIPLAALAGVLTVVAYDMSEIPRFMGMRRAPKSDLAVMVVTFALTVVVDLTAAVQVGVLLAIFLFIKRSADTTTIAAVPTPAGASGNSGASGVSGTAGTQGAQAPRSAQGVPSSAPPAAGARAPSGVARFIPPGMDGGSAPDDPEDMRYHVLPRGCELFEINGPFFFGVADMLQDALDTVERPPAVFILRMRHVPAIDATGLNALASFNKRCRKHGTALLLSGVRDQPRSAITKMGLDVLIGEGNILDDIDSTLRRAEILAGERNARAHGQKTRDA